MRDEMKEDEDDVMNAAQVADAHHEEAAAAQRVRA